ncbi:two-component sensor histidine kinase [Paractinoplanes deccanensis]|uniref:histidine kinase n=1 Tax=Paractinoplanes deccanensis TaxID=113561 RepID=A0ABQ3YJF9_9ACTN|nr:histidine kinase [Actinoplanes deccanensis]GID80138.1 two-component sensor histidine kinase [Actinoplanes deccanensis]
MVPDARWVDALLGAATAAIVATAVTANVRGDGVPPIAYVFAVGFGALMLLRRPYPVLTLAASGLGLLGYYALGLPPIGLALPVGAALYSAAEAGKLRWAIASAATLVAVSSVARSLGGEDPGYLYAYELPTTVAVMAAAILLGEVVRTRRLWRAEVAAGLAREAGGRIQEERLALARDLHDVLAHTISVVTLHADVADEALDDDRTEAARRAIRRIRQASAGAGRELRGTLEALRGRRATAEAAAHDAPIGALSRLDELLAGAPVEVVVEGDARPLPQVVDATAYRIVQEALTNARRHAAGRSVRLTISYTPGKVALRIVNEGAATTAPGNGHGLNGMRERATLLGGTLHAGAAPDGTFAVTATLPAEPAA